MDATNYNGRARIGRTPKGLEAEMTAQIVAMTQPELAGECRYWAELLGERASTFHRETLAAGLAARRAVLEEQFGKIENSPKRRKRLAEWIEHVDRRKRRELREAAAATEAA